MTNSRIRLAIADDHALLRQSLKMILDTRACFKVIFDASNGAELLEKLKQETVDIILLDLEMPIMGGFEALQKISAEYPKVKCVILSYFNETDFIMTALKLGAKGFIPKNCTIETFEEVIQSVMEGSIYVDRAFSQLIETTDSKASLTIKADHPFTNKEMAIIRLICAGKTNKEISVDLEIAVKTVENHRSNIFIKAGVKNVAQLVLYSIQNGIVVA